MRKVIFFAFSLIFVLSTSVFAQEISVDQLMDMNLKDILTVKIVSGSIMKQSIENSPIIIDVITKEQIRDFNADDLYELISYLPGVQMSETFFGRTVLNFRGVKNYHYENKVLLTLNGKPMFEAVNGSFFLEMIPINSIERIEVIRGQGGTLMGTNAYSGVINIVTTKGNDNSARTTLKGGYGSYNTLSGNFNTNYKLDQNNGLYFAASAVNGKGYPFNVVKDEAGKSKTFDYQNNYQNAFLNFSNNNISVDVGYMNELKSKFGITPNINYTGLTHYKMFFASADYKTELAEKLGLTYSIKFNRYNVPEADIGYFPTKAFIANIAGNVNHDTSEIYQKFGGYTLQTELQTDYKLTDNLSNISGLVYETAKSDEYEFLLYNENVVHPYSAYLTEPHSYSLSAYTQFEYKPIKEIQTVAGIRVVKDQQLTDLFLSPRLGIIYSLEDKYFFKALYGEGFRIPSLFEKYVTTYNVLYGSPSLNPEKADNYDLVFEGLLNKTKARLDGFMSFIRNDITRVPTQDPATQGKSAAIYINDPAKYLIYGIEGSISGVVTDKGSYGVNVSWEKGKNRDTKAEMLYSANITASGWLNYKITDNLSVTPYAQYIGKRKGQYQATAASSIIAYTLPDYILANLNIKYRFDWFVIDFTLNNILNKDYTYPEYIRYKIPDIPGGRDRSFRIQLSYDLL